jgi:predicted XRE-type DNA-binding protein
MKKRRDPKDFAMSQRDVAKALDIDRGLVSYLEQKALDKFAKELAKRGYTMEDFFDGEINERK